MENRLHFIDCDRMPRSKAQRVLAETVATLKRSDPFYSHIVIGYNESKPLDELARRCAASPPPAGDLNDWAKAIYA